MNLHQFYIKAKHDLATAQADMALATYLIDHAGTTGCIYSWETFAGRCVGAVMKESPSTDPNRILGLLRDMGYAPERVSANAP